MARGGRASKAQPDTEDASHGSLYEGRMVVLAANKYRGVSRSTLELVQNGFDAGADRIIVGVNHKLQVAFVADNGTGVDRKQFEFAINNIGFSTKPKDLLGRWGIGMVSPMTDCETHTFTSWASTDGIVREWTLREAVIIEQRKLSIPIREHLEAMPSIPDWAVQHASGDFAAEWRTHVGMDNLKRDRVSNAFDPLEFMRQVRARFNRVMRGNNALVRVVYVPYKGVAQVYDINPIEFSGESLGVVKYTSPETGLVEIELYAAEPAEDGRRYGDVFVMAADDNTAVTIGDVSRQALAPVRGRKPPSRALREAFRALRSGFFTGEIRVKKIKLDTERDKFEMDDAFREFLKFLEKWFEESGSVFYGVDREETRDRRWRDMGRVSEQRLIRLLNSPQYTGLLESFAAALGAHRPEPDPDCDVPVRKRRGTGKMGGKSSAGNQSETSGEERTSRGIGLRLAHAPLRTKGFWEFELSTVTLTINTGHHVWGELDETNGYHEPRNSRWTSEMQDWLALAVVVLLAHHPNPDDFHQHRSMIDDMVGPFAQSIVARDTERRRKRTQTDVDVDDVDDVDDTDNDE